MWGKDKKKEVDLEEEYRNNSFQQPSYQNRQQQYCDQTQYQNNNYFPQQNYGYQTPNENSPKITSEYNRSDIAPLKHQKAENVKNNKNIDPAIKRENRIKIIKISYRLFLIAIIVSLVVLLVLSFIK